MHDRLDSFHEGQVWESPRGSVYRVMGVNRNGKAHLRLGANGVGRLVKRDWDAVINWMLLFDPETKWVATKCPEMWVFDFEAEQAK